MPRAVPICAALAAVGLISAIYFGALMTHVVVASTMLGSYALITWVAWKRRMRYDLTALRALHESGGPPPSSDEIPEVDSDAGIYCTCCGESYAAWMKVCPNCKR